MKRVLTGLRQKDFDELAMELKVSPFRARQIHNQIYLKSVSDIQEMTDLSKSFRNELSEIAVVSNTKIVKKQISKDGTIKYLLEFPDQHRVETVLMRFDNRANLTACVSSQIGCPVNCRFCATGANGFVRNLTASEIVDQVLTIQRDTGLKVTNVVFMGQGEPLLNLKNVLKALDIFNVDFQIGARRITISTSGIAPKINELAELNLQSTLALSLHCADSSVRKEIMPIENKFPLTELKKSLKNYIELTGRRITIEYLLIKDLTDTPQMAKKAVEYLKDLKCNINLIPYNSVENKMFKKPLKSSVMKFKYLLEQANKKVTIRLERGADIDAACGQLNGKYKNESTNTKS